MNKRKRALVDVDGVLIDFLTPSLEIVEQLSGKKYVLEDLKSWDLFDAIPRKYEKDFYKIVESPGFCSSLPIYPGAVEGLQMLQEHMDIYIVTSPLHSHTWVYERSLVLTETFGIPRKKQIFTSAKYTISGDILVEDNPDNLEKWSEYHPHSMPVLWHQPYNRRDLFVNRPWLRAEGWHHVLKHLELQG